MTNPKNIIATTPPADYSIAMEFVNRPSGWWVHLAPVSARDHQHPLLWSWVCSLPISASFRWFILIPLLCLKHRSGYVVGGQQSAGEYNTLWSMHCGMRYFDFVCARHESVAHLAMRNEFVTRLPSQFGSFGTQIVGRRGTVTDQLYVSEHWEAPGTRCAERVIARHCRSYVVLSGKQRVNFIVTRDGLLSGLLVARDCNL